MTRYCENCGSVMPSEGDHCFNCGAAVGDPNPEYPMKWFRFLTRVVLIFGAVLIIILGVVDLLGLPYTMQGYDASLLYAKLPLLLLIDTVYGVLCLGIGVLFLICRSKLLRFRPSGPILLYISYALSILIPVVYAVLSHFFLAPAGTPLVGLTEIAELTGMAAGIVLNVIYFRRRRHMFV